MLSTTLRNLRHAAVTSYYFNKSDIKTIMFPISVFAQSLVHWTSFATFATMLLWTWLELLEFTISNQTFGTSPDEDAKNKPYRPIPAKLITLERAQQLRWIMPVVNTVFAYQLGVLPASLGISLFTYIHNEYGSGDHWFGKQSCTAILYALFEIGATSVAGPDISDLSPNQLAAVLGSALMILCTVHAQDFRDVEGDAAQGRKTFPILCPAISRLSMPLSLLSSSGALMLLSESSVIPKAALMLCAIATSVRFMLLRTQKEDSKSYLYYNIWLCLAHTCLSKMNVEGMPWAHT